MILGKMQVSDELREKASSKEMKIPGIEDVVISIQKLMSSEKNTIGGKIEVKICFVGVVIVSQSKDLSGRDTLRRALVVKDETGCAKLTLWDGLCKHVSNSL